MNKLEEICAAKREVVAARKGAIPYSELEQAVRTQSPPRGFEAELRKASANGFGLIAEIKRASPSKGLIREDFQPARHAADYEAGSATCLSVLTDAPFFQGKEDDLVHARSACTLPVLRKDFMVDPWQCLEARAIGSDAILIIVAALEDGEMAEIEAAALECRLDVLVEVHDEGEMERAARVLKSRLIGINNRDLKTFTTTLSTTERLAALAPDNAMLVGESGISTHEECLRLARAGVRAFLVGESLMRADDMVGATRKLLRG